MIFSSRQRVRRLLPARRRSRTAKSCGSVAATKAQSSVREKFRFTRIPIFVIYLASRTPQEGRCASSRNVGRGMRWPRGGVGQLAAGEAPRADGEVVWS
jgi:hypothetical protein